MKDVKKTENSPICLFDFEDNNIKNLIQKGHQIYSATLGDKIELPKNHKKNSHFSMKNYNIPDNFQEHKVIIFGFCDKKFLLYKEKNIIDDNCIVIENEKLVFNPQPLSAKQIMPKMKRMIDTKSLIIVFGENDYTQDYSIYSYTSEHNYKHNTNENHNLYSFIDFIGLKIESRSGFKITFISNDERYSNLKKLIEKNKNNITYKSVFTFIPSTVDYNESFIPLIINTDEEIISFILYYKKSTILFLPSMKNKGEILESLLNEVLPELEPELFPYSSQFYWLEFSEYKLPKYKKFLEKKEEIETKYNHEINKINDEISKYTKEFDYLYQMLSETGEVLLKAVKKFLEWLGFTDIKIPDETKSIKEEDLQIETKNGLLLIEIKGIGGTSKDSDCSQILKVVNRTMKSKERVDVLGIYIVNHQRYLPPLNRTNPPFTENQIKDAENDGRGLLTTWNLFQLNSYIENNIITKEEAMNRFNNRGIISFLPKEEKKIGTVKEIYRNGFVIIIDLINFEIKINEELIVVKNNNCFKVKIINIQINGKDVLNAIDCEVGLEIDKSIEKGIFVYKI